MNLGKEKRKEGRKKERDVKAGGRFRDDWDDWDGLGRFGTVWGRLEL